VPRRIPFPRLALALSCGLWLVPVAVSPPRAWEDRAPGLRRPHPVPPPPAVEEFPPDDVHIRRQLQQWWGAKEVGRRLAEREDDAETLDLLLQLHRTPEALEVARRIVIDHPDRMARALETLYWKRDEFWRDELNASSESLNVIVDLAADREDLSREDAARVARWRLMLERDPSPAERRDFQKEQAEFVETHPGTEAALLTRIDILGAYENRGPATLWKLQRMADRYRGTVVAAKALTFKGYGLSSWNDRSPTDSLGHASAEAFVQLAGTVRELERGRYPPCRWVEEARRLVPSFYFPHSPSRTEDIDTVLAACKDFLRSHLDVDATWPLWSGAVYLLAGKMGDLFDLRADRVGGVERTLDELERTSADPDRIRYLRILCYLYFLRDERPGSDSPMFEKSRKAAAALAENGREPHRHRALAILASLYFTHGDYASAERKFREFVWRYPRKDYAWVAALRAGQCCELQGDLDRALLQYRKTASARGTEPMALVLSEGYAGWCLDGLGRFGEALDAYRHALANWDDDYGQEVRALVDPKDGDSVVRLVHRGVISKSGLEERASVLERSLRLPGGEDLETGRWLFDQSRWDEALVALGRVMTRYPGTEAASEARFLDHLARLETALDLADVEGPAPDPAAARTVLERVAAEPYDLGVSLARVALATLDWNQGDTTGANTMMSVALESWRTGQDAVVVPESLSVLKRNVVEIRDLVFCRGGRNGAAGSRLEGGAGPPSYQIVDPRILVATPGGRILRLTLPQPFSGGDSVLFAEKQGIGYLTRIIDTLGGTERRQPASIMSPPNEPGRGGMRILEFWNRYFPCRPGHWRGWMFETFPVMSRIKFLNREMTRAAVPIVTGYEGATVVVKKEAGAWVVEKVVNRWIT
jgi:tetratricopeptide (TPR) repeat protein